MPAIACPTMVTCAFDPLPTRGRVESEPIADAVVAWEDDRIVFAGPRTAWEGDVDDRVGGAVVPGFVDCHTHLPFIGWRDDEYEARLRGASYRDLHGEGGISRSAAMLAQATDREVLDFSARLAREMLEHGTTAIELKTGYGLSVEGEVRQARLARRLANEIPQTATVTLLACHAVPPDMDREDWVDAACAELIPAAAREGLVDAVDVYVEDIAFSVDDLQRVAEAAERAGLPIRCHADQLGHSGATEAASSLGARSADHLNRVGPEGVRALGGSHTAAVLLPGSTLLLGDRPPPVGDLLDAGAAIACATDLNPGTSPVASMPEALSLGCALYRISPGQALAAGTANAAWVIGLHHQLGSLEPGKRADLLVLEPGAGPRFLPYRPGHNPVAEVVIGGVPVSPRVL